jgi:hypothetical protein
VNSRTILAVLCVSYDEKCVTFRLEKEVYLAPPTMGLHGVCGCASCRDGLLT